MSETAWRNYARYGSYVPIGCPKCRGSAIMPLPRRNHAINSLKTNSATHVFLLLVALAVGTLTAMSCGGSAEPTATQAASGPLSPTPTAVIETLASGYKVTIHMSAPTGSYQEGQAVLESVEGGTRITVDVQPEGDSAQPIHIHAGSCSDVGSVIVSLENVIKGHSESFVDQPLEDLVNSDRLINVHRSFQDFPTYTACGDLPDIP